MTPLDVSDNPATVRHMTPDYMPVLSVGKHENPQDGACVMEYVSLLAGEPWSDRPACTHPVLAHVARTVNDNIPNANRHLLVPMINRLFGTAPNGTDVEQCLLSSRLADWCATDTQHPAAKACATSIALTINPERAADLAKETAFYASCAMEGLELVAFLSRLLDEYDRLTGRATSPELSPTSLRVLSAAFL